MKFVNNPQITSDAVKKFETVMELILDSLGYLKVWAMDLTVELQNHLLGDYADCKFSHRKLLDNNNFFVVSINRYDELMKYFNEETEHGRKFNIIQEEIQQEQTENKRTQVQ